MVTTSDMELLMTWGTSRPASLAKRLNAWRGRRNEWYSQICGYRVSNGMAVRNGLVLKSPKREGAMAEVTGISRTFANAENLDSMSPRGAVMPILSRQTMATGGHGRRMSYGGRLSDLEALRGESRFSARIARPLFRAPLAARVSRHAENLAKMTKEWMKAPNGLYSQWCGFEVSNGMAVRNGLLMPLCGLLAIGLAETSLIGALLLGAATVALAWNLFNESEKERR